MKTLLINAFTAVFLFVMTIANYAQIAPDLKSAGNFAILAGTTITAGGLPSQINDLDVGLSPGFRAAITGFPPSTVVNGEIFAADDIAPIPAMLIQAKQDLLDAYLFAAASIAPAPAIIAGDQGGSTLYPGIYKSTSSFLIQNADLTLDAQGNPEAVWIFQIASELITVGGAPFPSPAGGNVILTGGALANNVFWQVGSSATIGDYTSFKGNIMALASITLNTGAKIDGRLLAQNGAVTMAGGSTINKPEEWQIVLGGLKVTKTAIPKTFKDVDDIINYSIVVENTGTEILFNIEVTDDLTGGMWSVTLLTGETATLPTSYSILQTDIEKGFVVNIVTAEVNSIIKHAYEVITAEDIPPPPVPISNWALIIGGVLILSFLLIRFRRIF